MSGRLFQNLFGGWFRLSRCFPAAILREIRDDIARGERSHAGELCLAIEARFSPWQVLGGLHTRGRAAELFSALRVWDTQDNSGVLLYLQLAERRVEILADRGISARVDPAEWQSLCAGLASGMRGDQPARAVADCLARINALLTAHFPASQDNPQELPDEPVIL